MHDGYAVDCLGNVKLLGQVLLKHKLSLYLARLLIGYEVRYGLMYYERSIDALFEMIGCDIGVGIRLEMIREGFERLVMLCDVVDSKGVKGNGFYRHLVDVLLEYGRVVVEGDRRLNLLLHVFVFSVLKCDMEVVNVMLEDIEMICLKRDEAWVSIDVYAFVAKEIIEDKPEMGLYYYQKACCLAIELGMVFVLAYGR